MKRLSEVKSCRYISRSVIKLQIHISGSFLNFQHLSRAHFICKSICNIYSIYLGQADHFPTTSNYNQALSICRRFLLSSYSFLCFGFNRSQG
ncbi:hypothetical protein OIU79_026128 [Salix purpurea]|uniref:Uncharacterized protein n=1 Tax=Salix purpurea TaxID=77065 RepID=A0A9Q0ZZZ6_SALPP|nr:hypothetical protein OIU79_026128 [Salix purpurea]